MHNKQTFKKSEKLCHKRLIQKLFTHGKSFYDHPFKVIYCYNFDPRQLMNTHPVRVLLTVSKKHFKKAVDRNRVKRLMRESYRKNKSQLYRTLTDRDKKLLLAIIFTGRELPRYADVEKKIIDINYRLIREVDRRKK
jgi:ribonuclease P protein component